MMKVASILDGHTVAEEVSLVISPGSKQVLTTLAHNGALEVFISSGARLLESSCVLYRYGASTNHKWSFLKNL